MVSLGPPLEHGPRAETPSDGAQLALIAGRLCSAEAAVEAVKPGNRVFVGTACATPIGLVQALICDVRFAARGARFTTAFTRRGLAGEYNLPYVLPRVIGLENALDLLLSGRVFDADEAKSLGLVSRVVEPLDLLDAARAYARDIARNCSPRAMAVLRHQVYGDLDRTFTDALARSYSAMEFFAGSPDFREGVSSFVEKREPKFEGLPPDFDPDDATRDAFLPY